MATTAEEGPGRVPLNAPATLHWRPCNVPREATRGRVNSGGCDTRRGTGKGPSGSIKAFASCIPAGALCVVTVGVEFPVSQLAMNLAAGGQGSARYVALRIPQI
jgi:hypothetical protein